MIGKVVNTVVLLTVLLALLGCQKLQLKLVDANVHKPSNVVLYFTVDSKKKGVSLPALDADNFRIYEDEQLLTANESKLTILDPQKASQRYTMLLLDMSAPSKNDDGVPWGKEAVAQFVENVGEQEKVAVFAFDGRKELIPIVDFDHTGERQAAGIERLAAFEPKDDSRNLNGGVVEAAATLKAEMDASPKALALGTLLVLTEGTDRAHRATVPEATSALKDAGVATYVVALGAEVKQPLLPWVDKGNFVSATTPGALADAFVAFATRIKESASKFYLLSYCSPSRAGTHNVVVEAVVGEDKGRFVHNFDADGFGPDCDPTSEALFGAPNNPKKTSEAEIKDAEDKPKEKKKKKGKKNKKKKKKGHKKKKKGHKKKKSQDDSDMIFD